MQQRALAPAFESSWCHCSSNSRSSDFAAHEFAFKVHNWAPGCSYSRCMSWLWIRRAEFCWSVCRNWTMASSVRGCYLSPDYRCIRSTELPFNARFWFCTWVLICKATTIAAAMSSLCCTSSLVPSVIHLQTPYFLGEIYSPLFFLVSSFYGMNEEFHLLLNSSLGL